MKSDMKKISKIFEQDPRSFNSEELGSHLRKYKIIQEAKKDKQQKIELAEAEERHARENSTAQVIEKFKIKTMREEDFSAASNIVNKFCDNQRAFHDHKQMKFFQTQEQLELKGESGMSKSIKRIAQRNEL